MYQGMFYLHLNYAKNGHIHLFMTKIKLTVTDHRKYIVESLLHIFSSLFLGVVPRVMWISIGGAIFLGIYDETKIILNYLVEK